MTVGKLIRLLEEYDEHQEVRVMVQPSWPLVHELAGVVDKSQIGRDDQEELVGIDAKLAEVRELMNPLYILASDSHPHDECYGHKNAWEAKRS